jgi:hypothetical protein
VALDKEGSFIGFVSDFVREEYRLGHVAHGFAGIHAASLHPSVGLFACHIAAAHEDLLGPFHQLAGLQFLLDHLGLDHEFRVEDGDGRLVGDGRYEAWP